MTLQGAQAHNGPGGATYRLLKYFKAAICMGWGGVFEARIKQMAALKYLSNLCADYPGPGALQCHRSQTSKKVRPGKYDMSCILKCVVLAVLDTFNRILQI